MKGLVFLLLGWICVWPCAAVNVVVIDPGHGGFDRGGIPGQLLPEKNYTLDTALRLQRTLRRTGRFRVIMTRSTDVFVSLSERTNLANGQFGAHALFVSIHYNAAPRRDAYGIETYYFRPGAYALARLIEQKVVQATGSLNRGVRRRGYWVLRRNALPAVLVECGFLTNPTEGRRASTTSYRESVARAIAAGIEQAW